MLQQEITVKTVCLLALFEHGPKYGAELARVAPDVFLMGKKTRIKKGEIPQLTKVYVAITRAVSAGYLEHAKDYTGTVTHRPKKMMKRISWYRLTTYGRETLRKARAAVNRGIASGENIAC